MIKGIYFVAGGELLLVEIGVKSTAYTIDTH